MTSISWIEEIYNNTNHDFVMWSKDAHHNGEAHDFDTNKYVGKNDEDEVIHIRPGARLKGSWMGIPWYDKNRYRVIAWTKSPGSVTKTKKLKYGLRLFQSTNDSGDFIHFVDHRSGRELENGKIPLPFGADRKFALSINCDDGGTKCGKEDFHIDLELRESKGNWQTSLEEFGQQYYEFYQEIQSYAAKAMIDAVARKAK